MAIRGKYLSILIPAVVLAPIAVCLCYKAAHPVTARSPDHLSAWSTFAPPGAHCSVDLPGTPQPAEMPPSFGPKPAGKKYVLNLQRRAFVVLHFDIPPENLAGLGPDPATTLITLERDSYLQAPGSRLLDETTADRNGMAGRDFHFEDQDKGHYIERIYLLRRSDGGAVCYLLSVEGNDISRSDAEVVRFFDSFHAEASASIAAASL